MGTSLTTQGVQGRLHITILLAPHFTAGLAVYLGEREVVKAVAAQGTGLLTFCSFGKSLLIPVIDRTA